ERKHLEKQRRWGNFEGKDINYVTSQALCTTNYNAEWTGGALAFTASESQSLTGLTQKLPGELSKYTNDAGLLEFARNILRQREPENPDPQVSLDTPQDMFWTKVDWRKDSHACLARDDGKVSLTGVIRLPNNSARSSEWVVPVRDAPAELANNSTPALPLSDVKSAFAVPKPIDALVSPRKTILVTQFPDTFVVYDARSATPLLSIPRSGRIVMAEWASGDRANTWAKVGDPPKLGPATSCTCDLGAICFESKCVKPKTVFVTSTIYKGDLGGLAGADAKCQTRAKAAGLDGEFKAWLSDSKTSAASRLTHAQVPYVRVDGSVLAKDWTEWTSGQLRVPLQLTELGGWPTIIPHPPGCDNSLVWTNTKEDGSLVSKTRTCNDWTDGASPPGPDKGGIWGQTHSTSLWSNECKSELTGCKDEFPLYCIEQ
ncbi:MAG TPA: hypothetical protein PK156_44890, partial [Polyangium sp.]|nr:hypothetical protein [Polyangium sp.]